MLTKPGTHKEGESASSKSGMAAAIGITPEREDWTTLALL